MHRRAWILATILAVAALLPTLLALHHSPGREKPPEILANGLCESLPGGFFTCRATIEPRQPLIVESIALRLGLETATINPPEPLMLDNGFTVTYTMTPTRAELVIHEASPPSIASFSAEQLGIPRGACRRSLVDERRANLSSGTAFPYETRLQPGSNYAYVALVLLQPPRSGGTESMASVDAKLFMLQDTLAWEFYAAEPAPLLPRVIIVPMGGVLASEAYYTKLAILYNRVGSGAPPVIPLDLRVYRTSAVHLLLRLRGGGVVDIALPLYCH